MTSTARIVSTPYGPYAVTARLPDGRLLIARLDTTIPEQHSPLRRALRSADITLTSRDR